VLNSQKERHGGAGIKRQGPKGELPQEEQDKLTNLMQGKVCMVKSCDEIEFDKDQSTEARHRICQNAMSLDKESKSAGNPFAEKVCRYQVRENAIWSGRDRNKEVLCNSLDQKKKIMQNLTSPIMMQNLTSRIMTHCH
jgi:hypothetical protein